MSSARSRRSLLSAALAALLAVPAAEATAAPPIAQNGDPCDMSLSGTARNDVLRGTADPDVICGFGGDDVIHGLEGDDVLDGGPGTDLLYGGPGVDRLYGGDGGDYLDGGANGGSLFGGPGADACVNGGLSSCYSRSPADPNDAPGYLDMKRVRTAFGDRLSWRVITFGRWTLRRMWDDGFFVVDLDTKRDAARDFYILVRSTGRRLRAALFEQRAGGDRRVAAAAATKPNLRTVLIRLPRTRLPVAASRTYFRWGVVSLLVNGPCARTCLDRVTNQGPLPHPWRR